MSDTKAVRLTAPQRRALEIIRDHGPEIWPREFGLRMWPDSPYHHRRTRGIPGTNISGAMGGAMWLRAGAFLGSLRRRGLLRGGWDGHRYEWFLTALAVDRLKREP